MDSTQHIYEAQEKIHILIERAYNDLKKFRKEGDRSSFNRRLMKVLPELGRYIDKRLRTALTREALPKGKYRVDDFVDQLYIDIYDHWEEIKSDKELRPWLFKKADELLKDSIDEETFDALFFENIDNYSKAEWDAMAEKYSAEGDGDLVMMDELDDISYRKHHYLLKNVFLEDSKKDLMAKLDQDLGRERIEKHADMVLHHLPLAVQTAFELFNEHLFDPMDIAQIMNRNHKEVEQLLETARKSMESSLYNQYLKEK
ncbi:MAG: sigma-70 family RNA polymerase sigma factor [Flavobacteriales bacterium]|nr:MAG: sigma-70 family RNA polymerase sigma factor [Flavobacteriales bacterium]